MIQLHSIKGRVNLRLTDAQLFAIGEYLMQGRDLDQLRIRIGVRDTTVQYHSWWGWDTWTGESWRFQERERQTRRRRGQTAIDNNRIAITFTAQARARQ